MELLLCWGLLDCLLACVCVCFAFACVCVCPQVTISCLINQISDLPPEQRRIPLSTIAGAPCLLAALACWQHLRARRQESCPENWVVCVARQVGSSAGCS